MNTENPEKPLDTVDPTSIYQENNQKPPSIYGAVYSGVPVYEMMCRNVVRILF